MEEIGYKFVVDRKEFAKAILENKRDLSAIKDSVTTINNQYNKQFQALATRLEEGNKSMGSFWQIASGGALGQLAVNTLGSIKNQITGVVGEAFDATNNYEQLMISFTTFLGSAEAATKVLKELTDFAVETPFSQDEIYGAGRQLLALGVGTDELIGKLRSLGDISAGTSKPLGELASIYGKVLSQGRAQGDELLQIAEDGIPI